MTAGDVRIELYDEQDVDPDALRAVLNQPGTKRYTGVKFRAGGAFEWLYLWLACAMPNGLSRMPGKRPGFTPHFSSGSMAALNKDSLAYLTMREGADEVGGHWEIGVIGHGPESNALTGQLGRADPRMGPARRQRRCQPDVTHGHRRDPARACDQRLALRDRQARQPPRRRLAVTRGRR